MSEKREQVLAQCRAVIHMAHAVANIHVELMPTYASGEVDELLDIVGKRTAGFMESLGDMLNSMDAADEADEWMKPVFAEAQRMWPANTGR